MRAWRKPSSQHDSRLRDAMAACPPRAEITHKFLGSHLPPELYAEESPGFTHATVQTGRNGSHRPSCSTGSYPHHSSDAIPF